MNTYNKKSVFALVVGICILLVTFYGTSIAGLFFTYPISRDSFMFIAVLTFVLSITALGLGFSSRREILSANQAGILFSYSALILGFIGLLITAATSLNFF